MVARKFSPVLEFFRNLVVLPPVEAAGFQLFGLRVDPWNGRVTGLLTFGDPLASGLAIRMRAHHHDPDSVWVLNESDRRIFFPAGGRLPGAYSRRLRVSLVLGPRETLKLHADLLEADPGWADDAWLSRHCPHAGECYSAPSRLPHKAIGAVVASGGRVLCLHLFDGSGTLRRNLPEILLRLSMSSEELPAAAKLREEDIEAWLERVSSLRPQVRPGLGMGREVWIDDDGLRGRCLILDEGPVHAEIIAAVPAALPAGELLEGPEDLVEAVPTNSSTRFGVQSKRPVPAAELLEGPEDQVEAIPTNSSTRAGIQGNRGLPAALPPSGASSPEARPV